MIKMLLFDLDDTLFDSNKVVSKRTRQAILQAHDLGIKIGYNTARSRWSVGNLLDGLPLDAIAFYSGALIFCDNNLIFGSSIPEKQGKKLLNQFSELYPDRGYMSIFEPYSYVTGGKLWKNGAPCNEQVKDIIQEYGYQRIILFNTALNDFFVPPSVDISYLRSRYGGMVITPGDVSKGNAVKSIASYFGISLDSIVSFGDDTSDFSMLRVSGTGVAMKNAVYEVKSVADYITDSHNNEGIAKWIEKHIL